MEDEYEHDYEYDEELLPHEEYETILSEIYQEFLNYYDGQIAFDEWRCLVDVRYRQAHGEFPLWDYQMEGRLKEVAYDIGQELIDKLELAQAEAEQDEAVEKQSEKLLRHIEQFLEFRTMAVFDKGHPSNRRFQRWEIARYTKDDFSDTEIESGASYDEALDHLQKQGYIHLVERGGKSKYDVFQAVMV
jgi:hypothetical protein